MESGVESSVSQFLEQVRPVLDHEFHGSISVRALVILLFVLLQLAIAVATYKRVYAKKLAGYAGQSPVEASTCASLDAFCWSLVVCCCWPAYLVIVFVIFASWWLGSFVRLVWLGIVGGDDD